MNRTPAPPDGRRHRLDALDRVAAARVVLDAILAGRWDAEPETLDLAALLVAQAAQRLRWADGCERAAA